MNKQVVFAVGLGPGNMDMITPQALDIIARADVVAGYKKYIELFPELFKDKEIVSNGMRGEIERCRTALETALSGKKVAVVSSGDAGVYAMGGLLMELTEEPEFAEIEIVVVPGITAASSAAALLGAPLMNDFAVLSLSDLMTPREVILKRIKAVAAGGLVCAIYNPGSRKRRTLIKECVDVFMDEYGSDSLVGIVKNAGRSEEEMRICSLNDFPFDYIDMNTIVVVGNKHTVFRNEKLYTLRGYGEKYGKNN